jgi:NAD(P)-dependent dehydrogenase (short-subunit alcohol dehydrogenase family)
MTTTQRGRRSLIIGGGTGIGLACARALCAQDGRVFLSGRRAAPLVEAAALAPARIAYATGDATDAVDGGYTAR